MDVRLPDGTVVKGVPDDISRADLASKLKANGMNVPDEWMQAGPKTSAEGIITGDKPLPLPGTVPQPKYQAPGMADRLTGALEAPVSLATGAVAGPVAAWRHPFDAQAQQQLAERMTYSPRTETGQNIVRRVGEEAGPLMGAMPELQTMGAIKGAMTLPRVPKPPMVDPETARLAQVAKEQGIPLRPDMLTKNKFARMAGEAAEDIPLGGGKRTVRQEAFNKALIRQIQGDPEATKLTPDVYAKAMDAAGKTIGDIAGGAEVKITPDIKAALDAHLSDAAKFETSDVQKIVSNYVNEITDKAKDGTLPGDSWRKIDSKIARQIRGTQNGDLRNALSGLRDTMLDSLEQSVSGNQLDKFREARTIYAKGKTLEPLVAKSPTGDISAPQLMGRVAADSAGKRRMAMGRAGDMGDLARIGQRFIKEPPSSGTAERRLVYGGLGGGLGLTGHPLAAAGALGAANLYNRLGPSVANAMASGQIAAPDIAALYRAMQANPQLAARLIPPPPQGNDQ